eukprot:2340109-Prymnesium_polylepis.1
MPPEISLHIFGFVLDTWALRSAASACRLWCVLLARGSSDSAADATWRAAWLELPRGRLSV